MPGQSSERNYEIAIHIGTHKTGSTAIQTHVRRNRDLLKKEGVVFIDYPLNDCPNLSKQTRLDKDVVAKHSELLNKELKNAQCSMRKSLLLSHEGFSGNHLTGYANADVLASHLREITLGRNVRIIIYVRRQDTFVESLYTQMIHQGYSYSFQTFLKTLPKDSFNWNQLATIYSESFGREQIHVRLYDRSVLKKHTDILHDFYDCLGTDMDEAIRNSSEVAIAHDFRTVAGQFFYAANTGACSASY